MLFFFFANCQKSTKPTERPTFSQKGLYYFVTSDSTKVGVQDESGKIIIPAKFGAFYNYDFENPISDLVIEFMGTDHISKLPKSSPITIAGEVYDRTGKFLYYPLWFDNGIDYYEEGFRRYVEGDKVGFVNKLGQKIIPAQWDFVSPFSYGYAEVFVGGWEKEYEKGGEHWSIVPSSEKSERYFINRKGERVEPYSKPKHPKDYHHAENEYYPYPFQYNDFEQKMIDSLENLDILNDLNIASCDNCTPKSAWKLNFEIIEKPLPNHPYYILQGYERQGKNLGDDTFAITEDGKTIYHQSYFGELTPLKKWIVEELEKFKDYFQENPDKLNRFDVDEKLREWKK